MRSASTCGALIRGVPLDTIIKQAGWSQVNTFIRNYLKPLNCTASSHEECEKVTRTSFPHTSDKEQSWQLSGMCQITLTTPDVAQNMTYVNNPRYQNTDNTGNLIRGCERQRDKLSQATVGHDTPPKQLINTGYETRLVTVRRAAILKNSSKFQKRFLQSNMLPQGKQKNDEIKGQVTKTEKKQVPKLKGAMKEITRVWNNCPGRSLINDGSLRVKRKLRNYLKAKSKNNNFRKEDHQCTSNLHRTCSSKIQEEHRTCTEKGIIQHPNISSAVLISPPVQQKGRSSVDQKLKFMNPRTGKKGKKITQNLPCLNVKNPAGRHQGKVAKSHGLRDKVACTMAAKQRKPLLVQECLKTPQHIPLECPKEMRSAKSMNKLTQMITQKSLDEQLTMPDVNITKNAEEHVKISDGKNQDNTKMEKMTTIKESEHKKIEEMGKSQILETDSENENWQLNDNDEIDLTDIEQLKDKNETQTNEQTIQQTDVTDDRKNDRLKEFWSDIDEIIATENIEKDILDSANILQNDNVKVTFEKGNVTDIPKDMMNALTAVVPAVDEKGKNNFKIFIYDQKDNELKKSATKRAKSPVPMNTGALRKYRLEPAGKNNYAKRIESLIRANAIASTNLYDIGGQTFNNIYKDF